MSDQLVFTSELEALFARVREGKYREDDLATASEIKLDGHPDWVPDMLKKGSVHDEDYSMLSRFTENAGTILDIGANWGYSVGSIRATGCKSPILSF